MLFPARCSASGTARRSMKIRGVYVMNSRLPILSYQARLRLRSVVEKLFGLQMCNISRHGFRECADIARRGYEIKVIFDVGANIGQSALKYKSAFPAAQVHCFEPVTQTFVELRRTMRGYSQVYFHQLALGSADAQARVYLTGQSVTNSLVKPAQSVGEEVVPLRTIDSFTAAQAIPRIDLLKIDTEGFDQEVLSGAARMFSAGAIGFVLVEAGFHPGDARHVLFDHIRDFLIPKGFAVFGIYDQELEWSGEPRLRFANVCFINENAWDEKNRKNS